jgi:hypothetical protein
MSVNLLRNFKTAAALLGCRRSLLPQGRDAARPFLNCRNRKQREQAAADVIIRADLPSLHAAGGLPIF